MKKMKTVYCVPWIEVEFGWGIRPYGYQIFLREEDVKAQTIKAGEKATHDAVHKNSDYFGPDKPYRYYEVPFDSLDEEYQNELKHRALTEGLIPHEQMWIHSQDRWKPVYRSPPVRIEEEN